MADRLVCPECDHPLVIKQIQVVWMPAYFVKAFKAVAWVETSNRDESRHVVCLNCGWACNINDPQVSELSTVKE